MKIRELFFNFYRWRCSILLPVVFISLTSCANMGKNVQRHGFEFNLKDTSCNNVEVLQFRYGNPAPQSVAAQKIASPGHPVMGTHIFGNITVGDTLYVKWRYLPTGEIFEELVDLKSRLPKDITDHSIYFSIRGKQLVVFLVSPDIPRGNFPLNGPQLYAYNKVVTIYPAPEYIYSMIDKKCEGK